MSRFHTLYSVILCRKGVETKDSRPSEGGGGGGEGNGSDDEYSGKVRNFRKVENVPVVWLLYG